MKSVTIVSRQWNNPKIEAFMTSTGVGALIKPLSSKTAITL